MAESPEAAFRQLRDRGIDAGRGRRAPGAGPDLPGLHRPPERGPAADDPREARRDRPRARPAGVRPARPRASASEAVAAIAEEVETLWLSDTIRETRPTVLDEVRQGLGVVEGSLLDVVPRVYRTLEAGLRRVYPGRDWHVPPFLRFGSWIGGDRDGHPGRHARRHGRGDPAPAGEPPPPLPRADRRPLAAAQPLRPTRSSPGQTFRASLAKDAALFPEVPASPRARALPGEVPADLRQAPPDARLRPDRSPAWAGASPSRRRRASTSAATSCSTT